MRLSEIYEIAITAGIAADPRGQAGVDRVLEQARKDYDALPEDKRWEFDIEALTNPYADTRILVGDPEAEVKSMLVGIDLEVGEVLLADTLRARGNVRSIFSWPTTPKAGRSPAWRRSWACRPTCGSEFGVSLAYGDAVMKAHRAEVMRACTTRNNEQDGRGRPAPRSALHVLPHPGRQQRQQLPAGALRRTGRRRHRRGAHRHAQRHPRVPAGRLRRATVPPSSKAMTRGGPARSWST